MRILVTGGAGFIGSHIADRYILEGHEVAILDDLSSGKQKNINPKSTFYHLQIQSPEIERIFKEFSPEIINHHAAHIDLRRSVKEPIFDAQTNILGTLNILTMAQKYGVNKIIFASTGGAIYGDPEKIPADEQLYPLPLSPYGANKLITEHYLRIWHQLHGIEYTIFRYPNVYGPRQDPHGEAGVVAIFSIALLTGRTPIIFGDGTKTRDYLFVSDVVEANVLSLNAGNHTVMNLGWGIEISDLEVFTQVQKALNTQFTPHFEAVRPGEVARIALNADLATTLLHWTPKVSFADGIERSTNFYRSQVV